MKLTYLKKESTRFSETVILLHGLGRTRHSFHKMEQVLTNQGYRVINCDYPSTRKNISTLAMDTIQSAVEKAAQYRSNKIHFVTHSLGGLLLREYLAKKEIPNLGYSVMLSPPNQGSEIVDHFKENRLFNWILGPAIKGLNTSSHKKMLLKKPGENFTVGIITGNKTAIHDSFFKRYFKSANDGKVSIQSAKLEGMKDFMVLPIDHTFIVSDDTVIKQTSYFLKNARFYRIP